MGVGINNITSNCCFFLPERKSGVLIMVSSKGKNSTMPPNRAEVISHNKKIHNNYSLCYNSSYLLFMLETMGWWWIRSWREIAVLWLDGSKWLDGRKWQEIAVLLFLL